ncbi:MAG: PEP-CTERM sorting domain-containing protein [Planctomycetes bacterium]|nr:PEP-CTERM sorting domain-containing protein [Planctomycetota bacterium]
MFRWTRAFIAIVVFSFASAAQAGEVLTFLNDYEGFLEAAGEVQTIDFETLPDGSPSYAGADITPDFNYTSQGATFLSPVPVLEIRGNPVSGFGLTADSYPSNERNWIIVDLDVPASAIGLFYPSVTTVSAFDAEGALIASETFGGLGSVFHGIMSETPIASATIDRNTTSESIHSFYLTPIPEPASVLLLGFGSLVLLCRKRPHQL